MSDERGEMTPQELDELASAYLDGEATAEEAALVENDPGLQALVEELRAARNLVATPVEPPSNEVRDQMIAQALAHRAPVVSLERARRRLRPISPQTRVILAAAAVVAVIAMVGVTLFEQANRGGDSGGDSFASDDSGAAPEMADEPAMDAADTAAAPEPEPESAEPAEESLMDLSGSASNDADMADAPAEAVELLMSDEEAAAPASPESPEEDSAEVEPAMADEPEEVVPTSGNALLEFVTEADLVIHVVQLAEELTDTQGAGRADEATPIDLMGCSLFPDEGVELLARFDAFVEETEAQVSVYLGENELRFTQTTPPPDCELFNSHTFTNWP